MKIRSGFVSNSSSSSYVIAYLDNEDVCKHCGRSDPSIESLFSDERSYQEEYSAMYAKGKDEVVEELRDMFQVGEEYGDDEQTARFIKYSGMVVDKVEEGWEVAYTRIPYSDQHTLDVLQSSKNVEFIIDWG